MRRLCEDRHISTRVSSWATHARSPKRFVGIAIALIAVLFNAAVSSSLTASAADKRPNILLAIADDQSFPHAAAYGDRAVKTPAFDRIAREGVLFTNAFCASPGCSPSRAALLTGRHTWQLEHAGTHASQFPAKFTTYPDQLEQAGYHIGYTGKGWGPGNWKISGRTRNPAGPNYSTRKLKSPPGISRVNYAANFKDFLDARPADAPFCFWYGGQEPHRVYDKGAGLRAGKSLESVDVPPFLPDTPEIRSDLLDYYMEIEWFDQHLSKMLALLEERGELDNTLILVTADNGMPFPRAKANGYEFGIHVPLAVRWPAEQIPAGRVVDDLVGFVDFAPTFLEAASLEIPGDMVGLSLVNLLRSKDSGQIDPRRQHVLSARERHSSSRWNNLSYPIRALRTREYLYIRNFRPERWPAGDPTGFKGDPFGYYDIDACPSKTFLWEHRDDAGLERFFHWSVDKRPAEELFDVVADPGNLHNLADDPQYAETRQQLSDDLDRILRETGDPRMNADGGDVFETYRRYSPIRQFPKPPTQR